MKVIVGVAIALLINTLAPPGQLKGPRLANAQFIFQHSQTTQEKATNQNQNETQELEIKFQGVITGIKAEDTEIYTINVKKILEGPKPCILEGLKVEVSAMFVISGLAKGDPVEVFGTYLAEKGGCRVLLEKEKHYLNYLTKDIAIPSDEKEQSEAEKKETKPVIPKEVGPQPSSFEDLSRGRYFGIGTFYHVPFIKIDLTNTFSVGGTYLPSGVIGEADLWGIGGELKVSNSRKFDIYIGGKGIFTSYQVDPSWYVHNRAYLLSLGIEFSFSHSWTIFAEIAAYNTTSVDKEYWGGSWHRHTYQSSGVVPIPFIGLSFYL